MHLRCIVLELPMIRLKATTYVRKVKIRLKRYNKYLMEHSFPLC
jgi:hypothetical protein